MNVAPQPRPEQLGPCPICGKQDYHWGKLDGESVLRFYAPDGSRWDRKTRHGGDYIKTRVCMNCGNVQLFVRPKREKHDEAEESGETPSRFVATRPSSRPSPRPPMRKSTRRPIAPTSGPSKKGAPRRPKPKPKTS